MPNIAQMVEKCKGRASVWLCLNDRVTTLDTIEIVPGLEAEVIIKGRPEGRGKEYAPTVVELECRVLKDYITRRRWNDQLPKISRQMQRIR